MFPVLTLLFHPIIVDIAPSNHLDPKSRIVKGHLDAVAPS